MRGRAARWISACGLITLPRMRQGNSAFGSMRWRPARRWWAPVSAFVDIDATSPMRIMEDIDGAIDLFFAEHPDMVMNVAEAEKNPYFNLLEADETGALHVSKPLPGGVVARQQAPKVYEHAAATYVLDPAYLKRSSGLFEGRVLPHVVPTERSVDIDSPIDFKIAEFLMSERLAGR